MKRFLTISLIFLAAFRATADDTVHVHADTLETYVPMQRGTAYIGGDNAFAEAADKAFAAVEESGAELLRVIVSGSASPDGLWGNNIALSKARTDIAASYIRSVKKIPSHMVQKVDLMEDWGRLAQMIADSDLQHKAEALEIIRTKTWGERKTALRNLDGGNVWTALEDHFFPQLRCVKLALVYKCGQKKQEVPPQQPQPLEVKRDTVYIRDTIYVHVEAPETAVAEEVVEEVAEAGMQKAPHAEPWMMGVKTNLLTDAVAVPSLGIEIQLAKHFSLDLQALGSGYNAFVPADKEARFIGLSPELRWWFGDRIMRKGGFLGLHANFAWYTLEWKDGFLYQNGPQSNGEGVYLNAGNSDPVWSAGLTYGYSLGLGRKANWGLEFVLGAGYMSVRQNVAQRDDIGSWYLKEHQRIDGLGITKAGINLTYRFSTRRYEQKTDNK